MHAAPAARGQVPTQLRIVPAALQVSLSVRCASADRGARRWQTRFQAQSTSRRVNRASSCHGSRPSALQTRANIIRLYGDAIRLLILVKSWPQPPLHRPSLLIKGAHVLVVRSRTSLIHATQSGAYLHYLRRSCAWWCAPRPRVRCAPHMTRGWPDGWKPAAQRREPSASDGCTCAAAPRSGSPPGRGRS